MPAAISEVPSPIQPPLRRTLALTLRRHASQGTTSPLEPTRRSPGMCPSRRARLRFGHFVRPHSEAGEDVRAERGADGDVGGISSAGHQDAPDTGYVVPRIERVPGAVQVGLEPP